VSYKDNSTVFIAHASTENNKSGVYKMVENNTKAFYQDIVSRPGKFEGEKAYVPFYWNEFLAGGADDDDGKILTFNVQSGDINIFPELKDIKQVKIYEREDGFVCEVK
jgi:hypothetical protein